MGPGLQTEKFILCSNVSLKRGTHFQLLRNHRGFDFNRKLETLQSYAEVNIISYQQFKEQMTKRPCFLLFKVNTGGIDRETMLQ